MPGKTPGSSRVVQDFAWKLTQLRQERQLSTRDLARLVGCTQPMITRMETTISLPSIPTLLKLCKALRVTPDQLLGFD